MPALLQTVGCMEEEKKKPGTTPPDDPQKVAVDTSMAAKSEISQEAWDKAGEPKMWSDSAGGRLAIRTFSRGILGAMFYTAGGLWARNQLKGGINSRPYNAKDMTFKEIVFEDKSVLKTLAKIIDTCVAAPIEHTVNFLRPSTQRYNNGLHATHFKQTKYEKNYNYGNIGNIPGRSLGEEAVFVTWDFFVMSVGDALGRDIAGWVDPVQRKQWMDKLGDEKGNFKWPETVNALCKRVWRYVSYNGGEDWAVAIPYVYFTRAHRHLMDRISPGFRFESDIALNASSLKLSTASQPYRVAGSYSMEAMLDYQSRFTAYNIGTLMYRELYDKIGNAIYGKNVNLYGAPDAPVDPNRSFADQTGDVLKWTARSIAKSIICMTPAVPFFSLFRATQNRENALFIDPEQNRAMAFMGNDNERHFVKANSIGKGEDGITRHTPVFFSKLDYSKHADGYFDRTQPMDAQKANPSAYPPKGEFEPYKYRHNIVENAFSTIGKWGQECSRLLDKPTARLEAKFGSKLDVFKHTLGLRTERGYILGSATARNMRGMPVSPDSLSSFTRSFSKASMAYTPYMYMKAETARLWDSGKTDLALERTIDGAAKLDWKEFRAGLGETFNAILHRPFDDPLREAEAERRILVDSSAADSMTTEESQQAHKQQVRELEGFIEREKAVRNMRDPITPRATDNLSWRERAVQGKQENGVAMTTKHTPKSHSEREEMRKFLEEANPITPSIH